MSFFLLFILVLFFLKTQKHKKMVEEEVFLENTKFIFEFDDDYNIIFSMEWNEQISNHTLKFNLYHNIVFDILEVKEFIENNCKMKWTQKIEEYFMKCKEFFLKNARIMNIHSRDDCILTICYI
jgi:hypothetical protein